MLVPRFTIRALLVIMTLCAVFFLVVGFASRGQNWAWGIAVGVLSLGFVGLVHAACFGMVWLFAQAFSSSSTGGGNEAWLTAADLLTPLAGPSPHSISVAPQTDAPAGETIAREETA